MRNLMGLRQSASLPVLDSILIIKVYFGKVTECARRKKFSSYLTDEQIEWKGVIEYYFINNSCTHTCGKRESLL